MCKIANEKLEDHETRLRKIENKDRLVAASGAGMDGDQIELILKAIDDSQNELSEKINKQLEEFASKDKFDELMGEVDGLLKRVQNLDRAHSLNNEKIEDQESKIEGGKKIAARHTSDIEQLKM